MTPRLRALIGAYQARVRWAVTALERAGIPRPASNRAWSSMRIPQRAELGEGIAYFKHGYGIAVRDAAGEVDFDFGAHGEIDGVDAWRLQQFAASRLDRFEYASEEAIKADFQEAVATGELIDSGYILYYLAEPPT